MSRLFYFIPLLFLVVQLSAQHTFSIVAVDPTTGEVGSAGATCLDLTDCEVCTAAIISGILPGRGAINAQASVCLPNINLENGMTRLEAGDSPQETLNWLILNDACIFGNFQTRQYGIADLSADNTPRAVGFTGDAAEDYAGHLVGDNYAIQGNILLGPSILEDMEAGFLATEGTLAQKLMGALQGANVAGADTRCLEEGVSSRSAYLRVARSDDDPDDLYLSLLVPQTPVGSEPIDSLQTLFDAFLVTSLADQATPANNLLQVFPNPSVGQLQIVLGQPASQETTLELLQPNGQLIRQYTVPRNTTTFRIDTADTYSDGLKFLVLKDANGKVTAVQKVLFRW